VKNRIRKMSKKSRDSVQNPNLHLLNPERRKLERQRRKEMITMTTKKKMMMKLAKLNISAHEGKAVYPPVLSVP